MPKSKKPRKKPTIDLTAPKRPRQRDIPSPWDRSSLHGRNTYRTQHNVRTTGNLKQPGGRVQR